MSKPTYPDLSDPAVIVAEDRTFFVCWVEPVAEQQRWIFVSAARDRYVGPMYRGEDSLERIRELLNEWWRSRKALRQQLGGAEKTRDRLSSGP